MADDNGTPQAEVMEADSKDSIDVKKAKFLVDRHLIPSSRLRDETDDLQRLGLDVFNQDDFEQGVMEQADTAIAKEEEKKKKEALKKELKKINDDIRSMKHEVASLTTQLSQLKSVSSGGANRRLVSAQKQKDTKTKELKALEEKKKTIQGKIDGKLPLFDESEKGYGDVLKSSGNETKDEMIRTGQMTPFGTVVNREEEATTSEELVEAKQDVKVKEEMWEYDIDENATPVSQTRDSKKKSSHSNFHVLSDSDINDSADEWVPDKHANSDSEAEKPGKVEKKKTKQKAWSKMYNRPIYQSDSDEDTPKRSSGPRAKAIRKHRDDGNEEFYDDRIQEFNDLERKKQRQREAGQLAESDSDEEFDGGLKVPSRIWKKLYKYQKTCVKWLWELHCQEAGGIIGDEMGLGKTVQAIAFLAGLKYSRLRNKNFSHLGLGPCLVVCPATVMHQWVKEFHKWWPTIRVAILHASGTFVGKERDLVRNTAKNYGILVTSYSTLVIQKEHILAYNWHYIILDEGHKIRNPDAQATLVCKQFRTPHRIILSGSPIQNNLRELWSLMDFVFPGKLGTLPDFTQHFAVPIVQGGYSNATEIQVQTAYKCACVLRDTINPYLLRRMKADVKTTINLPGKNEQVLFCRLTDEQKEVYREYLDSRECYEILNGRIMIFAGLIQLRKLCNHPDLVTGGPRVFKKDITNNAEMEYGFWKRSGKMIVVEALLKLWKKQGHKALLFTQSKQMLDIMELFVQMKGYRYVRMDGGTGISAREPLVQRYNTDDSIYLFLLTTRVGGLGINLVGANRIIIYDPDWNPSTDMQARERAWRIGQKREVTIYRLLTTGTIEEKIYHRQIFKQFLTNRVLKDPKQRRLFKTNDLYELFSLGYSDDKGETETAALFAGTGSDVNVLPQKVNRFDKLNEEKRKEKEKAKKFEREEDEIETDASLNFDEDQVTKMRELAKRLSQKMESAKLMKTVEPSQDSGHKRPSSHNSESSTKSKTDLLKSYKIKRKSSTECSGSDSNSRNSSGKSNKSGSESTSTSGMGNSDKTYTNNAKKSGSENASTSRLEKTSKSQDKTMTNNDKPPKRSRDEERSERHKRKKHKRKDAKFEGERIPHLVKMKSYKTPQAEETEKEKADEDNYVLQRLFKKTGIQGALKHDKIMDPGHSDYVIVENEADKVAREASLALKKSRAQCLPAMSGTPTWTGQYGGFKRPRFGVKKNTALAGSEKRLNKDDDKKSKEQHFDGSLAGSVQTNIETGASVSSAVSSTDLLNKMRVRNEVFTKQDGDENNEDDDTSVFVSDPSSLDLLKKMREFIMFDCKNFGQATTQEVLDEFGKNLPPENSAKFRALLNSICDLEKKDGVGVWKLRRDFR